MMQMVELHYQRKPSSGYEAVKARAAEILGSEFECSDPATADKAFLFFHKNHQVQYKEGQLPAQTAILATSKPLQLAGYQSDIQQSWRCPTAEELLRSCTDSRLVTEMMCQHLPPQDRVLLFHGILRAMIEVTEPHALVFKHTQQVIEPADYLSACDQAPILRPGTLNVRFFNISNSAGDKIMDTRGLTELGLPDLQCHFRNLDPSDVAAVLFNTAVYIFEQGAVIESGQTVAGSEPNSKWLCQYENSMLEPQREVLDVNPGAPHAAGDR